MARVIAEQRLAQAQKSGSSLLALNFIARSRQTAHAEDEGVPTKATSTQTSLQARSWRTFRGIACLPGTFGGSGRLRTRRGRARAQAWASRAGLWGSCMLTSTGGATPSRVETVASTSATATLALVRCCISG